LTPRACSLAVWGIRVVAAALLQAVSDAELARTITSALDRFDATET